MCMEETPVLKDRDGILYKRIILVRGNMIDCISISIVGNRERR